MTVEEALKILDEVVAELKKNQRTGDTNHDKCSRRY